MKHFVITNPATRAEQNDLLAALPAIDFQRLQPHLKLVHLSLDQRVCGPREQFRHVYFPTTAIISKIYTLEDGASTEVGMVGREGFVGVSLFLGGNSTLTQAIVKREGDALQLPTAVLLDNFNHHETVKQLLLRYMMALLAQMAQIVVCYRHHVVDHQLSRLLLMHLDRMSSNDLLMTHELIAHMLGVRRESITEAMHKLEVAGVISTSRGHISVLDRAALENMSCECYAAIRNEYDRLLPSRATSPRVAVTRNRVSRPTVQYTFQPRPTKINLASQHLADAVRDEIPS